MKRGAKSANGFLTKEGMMTYDMMRLLSWLALAPMAICFVAMVVMSTPWWPIKWGRVLMSIMAGCSLVSLPIFAVLAIAWSARPFLGLALIALVGTICFGAVAVFWKRMMAIPAGATQTGQK